MKEELTHYQAYYDFFTQIVSNRIPMCSPNACIIGRTIENPEEEVTCPECQKRMVERIGEKL